MQYAPRLFAKKNVAFDYVLFILFYNSNFNIARAGGDFALTAS